MSRTRSFWLAAILLASVAVPAARSPIALAGDPPAAPWKLEVQHEVDAQNLLLDHARRQKTIPAVVATYESRAGRDPSPLNHFLLGRARYYGEDVTGARTQMLLALEGNPSFWPAHVKLARLAADLKNWDEAERQVKAALQAKPNDSESLEVSALVGIAKKDWARAIQAYQTLLAKDPSNVAMRANLALVYQEKGDLDAAVKELEAWRAKDPANPMVRANLAQVFEKKRDYDAAMKELEAWRAQDPAGLDVRRRIAILYREKGDLPKAAARLEELLATPRLEPVLRLVLLDDLRSVYARMGDRAKTLEVMEKALPLVPAERRKAVEAMIEQLRKAPEGGASGEPRPVGPSELAGLASSPDVATRREALQMLFEAARLGYVEQIPGNVLRRVASEIEPDVECRRWVVKIMGELAPQVLPMLAYALYDEAREVRTLAADAIGEKKRPIGVAYLLPFVRTEAPDLAEFNAMRAALAKIVGLRDLPIGEDRVSTMDEAAAAREVWRRWQLSDASTATKLAAVRELRALDQSSPERFLHDFVMDPTFEVMREAYFSMRIAVTRPPRDAAEKKVFPSFPVVPDGEVTRESMRSIQERVAAWWETWIAEHRALMQAKGK